MRTKLTSDHWFVVLQTNAHSYGPKPFCFENMWTTHSFFKDLVSKWWMECHVEGWKCFKFMQKLGYVKGKLREWNRNTFGNLKANINNLTVELDEIDKLVEDGEGLDADLGLKRREVLSYLELNIKAKEMFWHQKAKTRWIHEGDGIPSSSRR